MKKILFFLTALVAAAGLGSCSDDTGNPYAHTSAITVDSTAVVFQAAPSTGFVTVNAPGGITAVTSSASWCTATARGSTVSLAVTQNDNLEGRSSQITIWAGTDSTHVTVQQLGFVFQLETGTADNSIVTNDDAKSLAFYMKHNTEIAVSTSAPWITPVVDGDSLRISVTENATTNPRRAYVYYSSGTMRDSIRVTQFQIDKDLLGDYYLNYVNSSGSDRYYNMNLYQHGDGSYRLRFTSGSYATRGFEFHVQLGTAEPTITVTNLDSLGLYTYRGTEYQVRLLILYGNSSSTRRRDETDFTAVGSWSQDDGGNYYTFDVSESPYIYGRYEYVGLRFSLSSDGTYDGISATLTNLYYAELQKADPANDD